MMFRAWHPPHPLDHLVSLRQFQHCSARRVELLPGGDFSVALVGAAPLERISAMGVCREPTRISPAVGRHRSTCDNAPEPTDGVAKGRRIWSGAAQRAKFLHTL